MERGALDERRAEVAALNHHHPQGVLMTTAAPPTAAAVETGSDREAWLALRRTAITATEAGAILGVSKFSTPIDVYLEKIGELPTVTQTPRMEAGHRMQRPIIDWWAERAEREVEHCHPFSFMRRAGSIMGASLDALTRDDASPIDAKNIG